MISTYPDTTTLLELQALDARIDDLLSCLHSPGMAALRTEALKIKQEIDRKRHQSLSVKEIVRTYLEDHGYDGLVNMDGQCGCESSDLAPCGSVKDECLAAHRGPCVKDDCPNEGRCDWHMYPTKEF